MSWNPGSLPSPFPRPPKKHYSHISIMLYVLLRITVLRHVLSAAAAAAVAATVVGVPPASATHEAGKVLIAVNHTMPELAVVEIDYRAHVLHGGVAYEWGQVSFQVSGKGGEAGRWRERERGRRRKGRPDGWEYYCSALPWAQAERIGVWGGGERGR